MGDEDTVTVLDILYEASEIEQLKTNKVPLSTEEREMVMSSKAIWHHGPKGAPSPAVWKSVCPKSKKVTYVTNTHRAYNTASTCKSCIEKYHSFIKKTR